MDVQDRYKTSMIHRLVHHIGDDEWWVVAWCRREVVLRMFVVRGRHLGEELCDAILRWGAARVRCISALMHCWMHLWNGTMHQRLMIKLESVEREHMDAENCSMQTYVRCSVKPQCMQITEWRDQNFHRYWGVSRRYVTLIHTYKCHKKSLRGNMGF